MYEENRLYLAWHNVSLPIPSLPPKGTCFSPFRAVLSSLLPFFPPLLPSILSLPPKKIISAIKSFSPLRFFMDFEKRPFSPYGGGRRGEEKESGDSQRSQCGTRKGGGGGGGILIFFFVPRQLKPSSEHYKILYVLLWSPLVNFSSSFW